MHRPTGTRRALWYGSRSLTTSGAGSRPVSASSLPRRPALGALVRADRPRLAGVPFFYWYQLAWVPGCSLAVLAAYALIRRPPKP